MKLTIVCLFVAVTFLHESYGSWITTKLQKEYGITGPITVLNYDTKAINCTGITGNYCGDAAADCGRTYLCLPNMPPYASPCPTGQTCNNGICSTTPTALCEYGDMVFKCNSEGMFPEPSSCKEYNYCVPPGTSAAIKGKCPKGWYYNAATTRCDKKLPDDGICPDDNRDVPTCVTAGQTGALKGSNAYYYVCLPYATKPEKLYPVIYRCEENKIYDGNYKCKAP